MYKMLIFYFLAYLVTSSLALESNFYSEEACSRKGGSCVLENECPHKVHKKYKRLCKSQQAEGAVCCKDFPMEELNCLQSHNECRNPKYCAQCLNLGRKGCARGQICCLLV